MPDRATLDRAAVAPGAPGAACVACGSAAEADGDGYCTACGQKRASALPPLPAGAAVGAYRVRHTSGGLTTASSPDGTEVLLVFGDLESLGAEVEAVERLAGRGSFPTLVERGHGARGPYLALSVPRWSAQMLGDVVQAGTVEQAVGTMLALLDVARALEGARFDFAPAAGDLLLAPGGSVLLTRVRGARRLADGERLDARLLLESLGEVFLPAAIRGPSELVRLLVPSQHEPPADTRTVEALREELGRIRAALSAPEERASVAEICDPGLWRPYNQDSTAIDRGVASSGAPFVVLVVCDGVSSSAHSDRAATIGARVACDWLGAFARSPDAAREAADHAMAQALRAAHRAICDDHAAAPVDDPPGTTIVAALVFDRRLTVGWVGDSRAYWLSERGAEQLTHDHSWINEAIARGELEDPDEVQGPLAHTITRCLGPLEAGERGSDVEPDVRSRDLGGPGVVLVCSDGLWNYAPKPAEVATVLRAADDQTDAAEIARLFVNYALARGGQDNVSVAVYVYAPPHE
jgi:serine/threonine protein phosphatase PrpC